MVVMSYLMLMRYWARATLSAFPVMVMVLSRLAGASLSSQLEIRIMAPESCLKTIQICFNCHFFGFYFSQVNIEKFILNLLSF